MDKLLDIYKKIPDSVCKKNCFECCTNSIQFTKSEEKAMGGYSFDGKCSHLIDGKCTVYECRPFVCRIYGSSELFKCENCVPERYLTPEETDRLVNEYVSIKRQEELSWPENTAIIIWNKLIESPIIKHLNFGKIKSVVFLIKCEKTTAALINVLFPENKHNAGIIFYCRNQNPLFYLNATILFVSELIKTCFNYTSCNLKEMIFSDSQVRISVQNTVFYNTVIKNILFRQNHAFMCKNF